jgi:hypothetical protein
MTGSYTDASTDAYGLYAYPATGFATCASTDLLKAMNLDLELLVLLLVLVDMLI